jgi:hypothetical protein
LALKPAAAWAKAITCAEDDCANVITFPLPVGVALKLPLR